MLGKFTKGALTASRPTLVGRCCHDVRMCIADRGRQTNYPHDLEVLQIVPEKGNVFEGDVYRLTKLSQGGNLV